MARLAVDVACAVPPMRFSVIAFSSSTQPTPAAASVG